MSRLTPGPWEVQYEARNKTYYLEAQGVRVASYLIREDAELVARLVNVYFATKAPPKPGKIRLDPMEGI
jgi:hypothetical protein